MEPHNNPDLKMLMNYRRMKNIRRCNTFPTINSIDVAQHSYYVTMLAMAIADEYNTWAEEHNLEFHPYDNENYHPILDTEVVLRKALLHDTEESITSDIPWNIKHMNDEINCALTKAIDERINRAYDGTKTMEMYHQLGKESKDGFEGQIVNIADTLELAIYCWEEMSLGNHYMWSMLEKCLNIINSYTISDVLKKSSPLFLSIRDMLLFSNPKSTSTQLLDID